MGTNVPKTSGVYVIRCVPTGKIYVGSAANLRQRWSQHRARLRSGTHHNRHLQAAWNRYGETAFEFEVAEIVHPTDLLTAEQRWIDATKCTDRSVGFNIFDLAGSPGDILAREWKGFISPDGTHVAITNLYQFCREHDLDWRSMHRLVSGTSKLRSYKGWTHENSVRKRDVVKTYHGFVSPDGHPVGAITNLAAFCRARGLEKSHMVAVARGRLCSHKGWTYENGKQRSQSTYAGFLSPAGEQVVITNLAAFCRANGLSVVHMHNVKSGKRKSHKGWTWREPNDRSTGRGSGITAQPAHPRNQPVPPPARPQPGGLVSLGR